MLSSSRWAFLAYQQLDLSDLFVISNRDLETEYNYLLPPVDSKNWNAGSLVLVPAKLDANVSVLHLSQLVRLNILQFAVFV